MPFALIGLINEYQRERIATFLDPAKDPLGSGFNTLQAEIGIGSGGLFGKGLTHGTQTQLDYLRTQTTDYIFSVLGEELGFVGAVVLFALFVLLLLRGLQTAKSCPDPFGRLLAIGVVTFILFQVFINIGVNIRLLPVTGIPLPFISQGGSSLITLFIALGILQSIRVHQVSRWCSTSVSSSSAPVPPRLLLSGVTAHAVGTGGFSSAQAGSAAGSLPAPDAGSGRRGAISPASSGRASSRRRRGR